MHSAEKAFFDRIAKAYSTLSVKKKRVADFVLDDYKKISLMTARDVALQCDVSEPTIIRFAVSLGFSGYLEFARHIKDLVQVRLSSVDRFDRLLDSSKNSNDATTLEIYCNKAIQNLTNLMETVSAEEIQTMANTLYHAKKVYVVGYRASAAPACYFGYFLNRIRENVQIDTTLSWEIMDSIAHNTQKSVIFVITFRRYSRKVIELLNYARKYKIKIVSITDSLIAPVIKLSNQYVVIDLNSVSFVDPIAHVISYLGALIHEITFIDTEKSMKLLKTFDKHVKIGNEFLLNENSSAWIPKF
jgi:DNA-binding MurR/RpiR family transcriptional regulator